MEQLLNVLLEALAENAETSGQTKIVTEQILQQMETKKVPFRAHFANCLRTVILPR